MSKITNIVAMAAPEFYGQMVESIAAIEQQVGYRIPYEVNAEQPKAVTVGEQTHTFEPGECAVVIFETAPWWQFWTKADTKIMRVRFGPVCESKF